MGKLAYCLRWVLGKLAYCLRWVVGYEGIPAFARPTFRRDFLAQISLSLGVAMMIPELTQMLMEKGFEGAAILLPVLQAQHAMGNFLGAVIVGYLQGVSRTRVVLLCRWITAAFLIAIAFLPLAPAGALPFVGLLTVPMILNGLAMNVRNSIRHANYPSSVQGRIISRLILLHMALLAIASQVAGWILDAMPDHGHRVTYLASAGFIAMSGWIFSRVRVRQERRMRRRARSRRLHLGAAMRVLVRDRNYGRYMFFQLISGSMVLMLIPIVSKVLVDPAYFGWGYAPAQAARQVLPMAIGILVLLPAGHLFDRLGISHFRAISTSCWAISRTVLYLALLLGSWPAAVAAFAVQGFGKALGGMAFNVGHMRFSHPHDSQLYMGAHLALQGIRGMTMPFVGAWLFFRTGVGIHVFAIAAGLQMLAALGFLTVREPKLETAGDPLDAD